ncbi:MAG: hypothetical protein BAJALOKI1v1_2530002 [Promethearchaeota archaeon]|nr:MAG: hypothetical protein BAJALOKI1v1_2530002 [Candidatus Lokiarchaeota archaeon]
MFRINYQMINLISLRNIYNLTSGIISLKNILNQNIFVNKHMNRTRTISSFLTICNLINVHNIPKKTPLTFYEHEHNINDHKYRQICHPNQQKLWPLNLIYIIP